MKTDTATPADARTADPAVATPAEPTLAAPAGPVGEPALAGPPAAAPADPALAGPFAEPALAAPAVAPAPAEGPAGDRLPDTPVRVAVVVGSNREGRFGPVVAEWLLGRVRERDDLLPEVVDVAEVALPTTLTHAPSAEVAAELARVSAALDAADAYVVLTPEYNHSFPAGLKNLVDWHYTQWRAKPVALVSYGGLSGGLRASEHLRQVFAELHAVTVRDTVSFHQASAAFDADGRLRDPGPPAAAAQLMLDRLVWWARALREAKERRPYGG